MAPQTGLAFSIAPLTPSVQPDASGRGEIVYTVTNNLEKQAKVRARVAADPADATAWLRIDGSPERVLAAKIGTEQFKVLVAVPPGVAAQQVKVQFDVSDVDDPNRNWTRGPVVTVEVPAATITTGTDKKKFPWWIVAAAGVVLLAGGAWWFFGRSSAALVHVEGLPLAAAREQLRANGLVDTVVSRDTMTGVDPGTVVRQEPDTGSVESRDVAWLESEPRLVRLWVESDSMPVPSFVGLGVPQLVDSVKRTGLQLDSVRMRRTADPSQHFRVVDQEPRPPARVARSGTVIAFLGSFRAPCLPCEIAEVIGIRELRRAEIEFRPTPP